MEEDIESFKVDIENFKKDINKKRHIYDDRYSISFMINQTTNEKVILKQTRQNLIKTDAKNSFYQKIKILAFTNHPAIAKFLGWTILKKKGNIYFRQEEKGTLEDIITNSRNGDPDPLWDNTHKFIISYGIASAMKYLHSNYIIHRNLNCSNILLDSELHPYISEIGNQIFTDDFRFKSTISQYEITFMPPDMFEDWEQSLKNPHFDVYSYAMILYCIWTEQEIFPNIERFAIYEKLIKGQRPEFSSSEIPSNNWRKLIESCWNKDQDQRPNFDQICQLLESSEFVNDSIDIDQFKAYKNYLENDLQKKLESSSNMSVIDRLKIKADEGNADSQLSYALRLYNGFEVEKNLDESKRYFELAAENGNAESQFYLSLILAYEGNIEKSTEYFQKSIDSGCSEAYSYYAKQLFDQGNIDESLPYFYYAIQRGSISALISYGNICEIDNNKYGCPDIFYKIASNCCHCLDSVGLYFPINYKVFKCEDCNIEMCEGCAKSCHKDHSIVEIGIKNAFVCGCGKNHFNDHVNKKHCSVEFVGEMKCGEEPVIYQHFYRCLDCSKYHEMLICKGCAENCHNGHKVIDCGIKKGFCCCGTNKFKSLPCKNIYYRNVNKDQCSRDFGDIPIMQRWFQCMTCGLYGNEEQGICISCAHKCHNDHLLLDRGVQRNKCQCFDINQCQHNK